MMAKTKEISTTAKIEHKFTTFLGTHKKLLIIIGIALVVVMLGLWAGFTIADKRANTLQLEIDTLQKSYTEWINTEDKATTEAQSMKETLLDDLTQLANKNSKTYPVLKATYLLGLMAFEEGEYTQSLERFLEVAERGKQTYLGSLALFNAGVSSELLNDPTQAIEHYQRLYDSYGGEAAEAPKALFSLARLYESNNNKELAKAVLQQLADEFPASEYAKLAQSRLVVLQ